MIVQLLLGLVFLFLVWKALKKPDNYPPGLWGLPGIGYIPLDGKSTNERLMELRRKHGDIVMWRMGTRIVVFVFDYDIIKEACQKVDFLDRPQIGLLSFLAEVGENAGLLISNGPHWQNMRRFALRQMRDLGMGKSKIVEAVHEEARYMVETLKRGAGTPAPLPHAYHIAVVNIIWQMVAGKRFEAGNPTLKKFDQMIQDIQQHLIPFALPGFMPWLVKVLPTFLYNRITRMQKTVDFQTKFSDFMMEFVVEHKQSIDYENQKDFINAYLVEMEKQKDDPESTMSERDLLICLADLFGAGSETTSTTLQWATLHLVNYPDVQKKLQKAVDEGIPRGTMPTLEDRGRLPYVDAFINEIHRYSSFIINGVMHEATRDLKLGDYFVPKGTILSPVQHTCHFDPRFWDNPNEFNPDRFLDKDGNLKKITEGFMPFGVGKRQCLGEALARVELFIFITTLAQNFNFCPPPGKDKIDLRPLPNPIINLPDEEQNILITCRQ